MAGVGLRSAPVLCSYADELLGGPPVNGHEVLPSGGRENSPYTVMSFAPLAVTRFPHSRESGWV